MQIEIWSDVVCPWCYIGKRRLERALEEIPDQDSVEIIWRSFELNPDAPRAAAENTRTMLSRKYGVSLEQADAMQERVAGLAAAEGLEYNLGRTRPENSFDAHRLIHLAKQHGRQGIMKERLLRAHFTEGQSIGNKDTLIRLANEVGLGERVIETLEGDAFADAVRADEERAVRLGMRGVPFFLFDEKFAVSGAQPVEVFREALAEAGNESADGGS